MRDATYRYCPHCATPLTVREIYRQQRPLCPACGFVHFADPKVAVIGLVTNESQVLLVQRAINPEKGKWALPGGYMDAGEMPEDALQRELLEEVHLAVHITNLLTIFPMLTNQAHSPGIVLAYAAKAADPKVLDLICDDDVCDANWFTADEIPSDLAFESTQFLLANWRKQIG